MSGSGGGGPEAKRRAIEALMAGQTITRAAEQAHVGESTLRRWLTHDTNFQAALEDARIDNAQRVATALATAALGAVRTLATLMMDESTPAGVRVSAARSLLAVGPTWADHAVLNDRVAAIEQALSRPRAV